MKLLLIFILLSISGQCFSKLSIITTTSNLASLVESIGGDKVEVESLCKGTQDPHFLEAKPSYTYKLSKADLLVSIGADLEVGWLPLVIRGSHNPKLREGQVGHLVASHNLNLIEKLGDNISRVDGDVHPQGNPHFMLSPIMASKVAEAVAQRLGELDATHIKSYQENLEKFKTEMTALVNKWKKILPQGLKVISHHRTLSYLYQDFSVVNLDYLEPKPGIPPTSSHIINLIQRAKLQKIEKIILENYFNDAVAKRIKNEIPEIQIHSIPVAVGGEPGIDSLSKLYERLLKVLEN